MVLSFIALFVSFSTHGYSRNGDPLTNVTTSNGSELSVGNEPVNLAASDLKQSNQKSSSIKPSSLMNVLSPSDKLIDYDKNLLRMANRLKSLSDKAFKEGNISLSKAIDHTYYDLLIKNSALHKASAANFDEHGFEEITKEYEDTIEQYDELIKNETNISPKPLSTSLSFTSYTPFLLDVPTVIDWRISTEFEFTPSVNGTYQFNLVPFGDSELDIEFNISEDSWPNLLEPNKFYEDHKETVTIYLETGHTYYLEILTAMSDPRSTVTVTKKPALSLNNPIDLSLEEGQSEVFQFTPSRSFNYDIKTIGYGGFESLGSEVTIKLFDDEGLTNLLEFEETNISHYLTAGATYYILLEPMNEPLHLRVQISASGIADLVVNVPTDANLSDSSSWVTEFLPQTSGKYQISADFYNGVNTGIYPDLTLLIYTEDHQLISYGFGDAERGVFPSVEVNLSGGSTYLVEVEGYRGANIKARVMATLKETASTELVEKVPYELRTNYQPILHYTFTPSLSDLYVFWTSSLRNAVPADTIVEVYSDPNSTLLVSSNDNYNNTVFSKVQADLTAGHKYYITLKVKSGYDASFMVATLKESIAPSNLSLVSFTSTGAKLNWHASLAKEMIQEYDIYNGTELVEIVPNSLTTYTVSEYLPNKEYHFTVKAKDSEGNISSASNTVTAIFDTQSPTVPSNLKVSGMTATSVNLTWTASTDNVGVTSYEIYKGTTLAGTSATSNYTVTGLSANSSYTFTVKAKDVAGNLSSASNIITVTTLPLYIPSIPIHYVYDSTGRIDYIQLSSGRILDYQYDSSGNLIGVIVE